MAILISFYTIYSTNTTKSQVKVDGWKQVYSNSGLVIYKKQDLTKLTIDVNQTYSSTGWATIRSFPAEYITQLPLYMNTNQGNVRFRVPNYKVSGDNGAVQYIITGSAYTGTLATMVIY